MIPKNLFFLTLLLVLCAMESGCVSPQYPFTGIPTIESGISGGNPAPPATIARDNASVPAEELQRGEETVHRFTGSGNTSLSLKEVSRSGRGNLLTFEGREGEFVVNSRTGRVQSARFRNSQPSENTVLSRQDLQYLAESYGKEQYPQLWNVSQVRSVNLTRQEVPSKGTTGTDYLFVWQDTWYCHQMDAPQYYTITGAGSARVIVDSGGRIVEYSEEFYPESPKVNLTPELTEEQAWEIAQAYFANQGITEITEQEKTQKGLWIYDDAANDIGWPKQDKEYLAWVFYVRHEGKWLMGGLIFVDAHDGHIISVAEIL